MNLSTTLALNAPLTVSDYVIVVSVEDLVQVVSMETPYAK